LFLRGNSASTKFLLEELKQLLVLLGWDGDLRITEAISWARQWLALGLGAVLSQKLVISNQNTYIEELSGILVAVVDSNGSSADAHIEADSEVSWLEWHLASVLLDDHLSLEESTLGRAGVDHLGLGDHDRSVFKEVEKHELADSEVFKSGFDNCFFEITIKAEHLYLINRL